MTAQPNISDFLETGASASQKPAFMRPNVTEHFWGFDVRPTEHVFNTAMLMRAVSGVLAGAAFIAALGVWLMPAIVFVATVFSAKLTISSVLLICAVALARVAARGTHVRVQFDTSTGELREVVDGAFGADIVLTTYGLDAVETVKVVESRENRGFGQVQILVRGVGLISAGDGALAALTMLRIRIANACGLEGAGPTREAVWGGPLAA